MEVVEFLGGKHEGGERWAFAFGEHINGAFGGVFGGVFGGAIAAAFLAAARSVAPGRVPAGIDCRFLRALSSSATVTASVTHEGRTLTAVDVRVVDERDRTMTSTGITLVNAEALHPLTRESAGFELPDDDLETWVPHPNPDLSLRFGAPTHGDPLVGVGRLRGIHAGLAFVGVEVFAGGSLAAIGVSYSLLLQP